MHQAFSIGSFGGISESLIGDLWTQRASVGNMESLLLVPEPPSPSRTPKEKRAGRHWALPLSQLLEYHLQATMSTARYQEACYGVSNYLHACLLLAVFMSSCPNLRTAWAARYTELGGFRAP